LEFECPFSQPCSPTRQGICTHLAHELAADLGGGLTGYNFGGDLFVEPAGKHSRKHLALTRGERCEPRLQLDVLTGMLHGYPKLICKPQGFSQVTAMQLAQISACNRFHQVDQRLARWLLMSQDRIGSNLLTLTQDFLAQMLGTRRSSVTLAAKIPAEGRKDYLHSPEMWPPEPIPWKKTPTNAIAMIRQYLEEETDSPHSPT
jgi:hypothetical protein